MKKKILTVWIMIWVLLSVGANDFLPDGGTADKANGKSTKAYFDFTPLIYEYHSFNFTGSPISGPDDILAPLADLYLTKSGLGVYTHSTNDLYFSYSFKGKKDFIVTLKGSDLNPRYKQGEVDKGQYFTTVTTVTYPVGYEPAIGTSERSGKGTNYTSLTVLPDTSIAANEEIFGTYGSLELEIVATYHKPKGGLLTGKEKPIVVTDGYIGTFTLECTIK